MANSNYMVLDLYEFYHFLTSFTDAARRLTKQSMRKQYVDELVSYEKQELEEIVKFVYLEQTQTALGAYVKSLKGAKK